MLLAVAPWTLWWERNLFAALLPNLSFWMANEFVRAAVSGVGLLTLATGLVDLRAWRQARRFRPGAAPARAPQAPAPRD